MGFNVPRNRHRFHMIGIGNVEPPPSTPKSKTMTLNMTTPPKRRAGMSVKTPGTIKNNR